MASKNHPLLIAEIVAIIFNHLQHVNGTSSLVACAQVSRLWAEEAIRRIWYQGNLWGYEVDSLLTMPNCRRQSYANHMRSIDDFCFKEHLEHYHNILLAPLKFPRLESASFFIPRNCDERFRLQYLVPSLRRLQLYDCEDSDHVSNDFFLQIQERCPNLEEFEIERPQNNAHADFIHRLLRNMPSIRRLSITSNGHCHRYDLEEGPIKDAYMYLFALLAKHETLKELEWGMLMFRALVEQVMETMPHPFRQLRNLICKATDTALVVLLPRLPHLEVLDVRLLDTAPHIPRGCVGLNILPSLAQCTNLRVFKLSASFDNRIRIPPQGILDFARACNRLEQLEIDRGPFYHITIPGITDSHFETLVSQLPGLRKLYLKLSFDATLSTRSLFSLGAHCPGLEELDLGGVFDLSLLGSTNRVLFPNLRETMLGHVDCGSESSSADRCAIMMYYHAPKSTFSVWHSDPFGAAVEKAHMRLYEKPHVFLLEQALENIGKLKDRVEQY